MKNVETFSTTADVGISIRGKDYEGLFKNAVKGLNLLLFGDNAANLAGKGSSSYEYEYTGDSAENVLVNLLSEVLFLLQCRDKITADIKIAEAGEKNIIAHLSLLPANMAAEVEIKSVTYHNLKIIDKKGVKYADVIFDI